MTSPDLEPALLEREARELEQTWRDPDGPHWLVDARRPQVHRPPLHRHRVCVLLCLAGLLAALMRLQLARPDNTFLGPDLYNQIFTTHGTTMMFLFAVPVMQGLGIYFVPADGRRAQHRVPAPRRLQLLDVPLRRHLSLCLVPAERRPGCRAGSPIRRSPEPLYTPSKRADVWAQLITFTEVASLAVASR